MPVAAYQLSTEEVLKKYSTSFEGISQSEAKVRFELYGFNKLQIEQKNKTLALIFHQFMDLMVIVLMISGLLSLFLQDYTGAIVLFSIVFINALIGFIQEYKAERVMDSLNSLVKTKAKVIREGKLCEIKAEEIMPGDIVSMEAGDRVPADIRLIEENELATNDFSLTGESNPVRKFTHAIPEEVLLGDRNNLVFMGTTVATGNAKGVAVATGMKTEIGRIANLSSKTKAELSPLQKELNNVAQKMTWVAATVGVIIFAIGLFRELNLRDAFIFALAVGASCVPQGMTAQVSVALSLSAGRLAQKKAVVKKLSAVETLGSTHVICTDKTGTLTTNEMTVEQFLIGKDLYRVAGVGFEPKGEIGITRDATFCVSTKKDLEKISLFFETGVLASNAEIFPPDEEHKTWYAIGDPTEAALISLAAKAGFLQKELNKNYKELKEFTFDAGRKMMTSVREIENNKLRAFVKGAPLTVLGKSTQIWDGTEVRPLNEEERGFIIKQSADYAGQALRVLAFAYRDLEKFDSSMMMAEVEDNLVFVGLVAMLDPPREEVKAAMEAAKQAYIRVLIITGDYAMTAEAIAKKIGIGGKKAGDIKVITTDDLAKMSDIALLHSLINENIIFSRTAPEDKLRIVDLLKKAGEIVAVTGDGVNDAPALKRADIGVAMGRTGTDVAKESAEIVLLDDSFGTLVTAIHEGRIIYKNLKKTILSSITSNGGELFTVVWSLIFGFFLGVPKAILAIQILAVDLIGEMLPLTFLTWDPGEKDIMKETPRNPQDFILSRRNLFDIGWSGFLMGSLAYINFILLSAREGFSWIGFSDLSAPVYLRAMTLAYVTIVIVQWANILSRRTKQSIFTSYFWSSPRLFVGYLISFFFLLNISYNPYVSRFFQTAPLKLSDWLMAGAAAVVFLIVREGYKKIKNQKLTTENQKSEIKN